MQDFLRSDLFLLLMLDLALWLWVWVVPTLVLRFPLLPEGILGIALPGLVLVRADALNGRLLRHELTHIRQMRRWSPLGTALAQAYNYILRPLWSLLARRRWPGMRELYFSNPLEQEAFAAMDGDGPLPRTWGARPPDL